jgi:rhomboid protease GluP
MESLNDILVGERYQVIPTDLDLVKMYGKIKGPDLYLLNVITLQENFQISLEQYEVYKDVTEKQFKPHGFEHIYLLNIFMSDEINDLYYKLSSKSPNYNDYLIDFQWLIDLDKRELHIPKNQPDRYLDIHPIVTSILNHTEYKHTSEIAYKTNKITATIGFLSINIIIWLLMELMGSSEDAKTLVDFGALFSPYIMMFGEYYRLFTAMFLHIGFSHLFYNMFALYLFGSRVEKVLGPLRFMALYLLAGLGGSLLSYGTVIMGDGGIKLAAGASGAIYGLQGAALYITMRSKGNLGGISRSILWIMTLGGLSFGFTSTNIDNMAHIGGLISGIILMALLMRGSTMNKKTN